MAQSAELVSFPITVFSFFGMGSGAGSVSAGRFSGEAVRMIVSGAGSRVVTFFFFFGLRTSNPAKLDLDSEGPPASIRAARAAAISFFCSFTDISVILSIENETRARRVSVQIKENRIKLNEKLT